MEEEWREKRKKEKRGNGQEGVSGHQHFVGELNPYFHAAGNSHTVFDRRDSQVICVLHCHPQRSSLQNLCL